MPMRDELGNVCQHVVRLHLRTLGVPRVSENAALRNAQATFGPHGICMAFSSGMSMPPHTNSSRQCLSLSNVNVGACRLNQSMTSQQDAMFGIGAFQGVPATHILCFWVNEVQTDTGTNLAGCASHPTDRGACVVAAIGSPWTLAHEVGHVLGLRHVSGSTNLMSSPTANISSNPPQLSASEIETVKRSRYCQSA